MCESYSSFSFKKKKVDSKMKVRNRKGETYWEIKMADWKAKQNPQ